MDDARAKVGDGGMPKARLGFLRLGGKEIEIVDAEDIKLLEEEHHLRLGDGHEIAWRESSERGGITLGETEEMLKLNDKGGIDNLAHAISMIVRLFLYGERTVGENDHSLAAVALADHLGVGRTLEEVKLGVGDNLLKVVAREAAGAVGQILSFGYLVLHGWGEPHLVGAVVAGKNEICHQFGMARENGLCLVEPHHHEGGGIGIGSGTVVGDDCR